MPYVVPENLEAPEMDRLLLTHRHPARCWDLLSPSLPTALASSSSLLVMVQRQGDWPLSPAAGSPVQSQQAQPESAAGGLRPGRTVESPSSFKNIQVPGPYPLC